MHTNKEGATSSAAPKWRPLERLDRRVLGVLIEKGKTTPDAYPLSLKALCTGCNQKSNRHPQMEVEPDDVEESLERLRGMGAVAEIQGGGRVDRYRHLAYDWLGVDKVEIAVMAELLLRGEQTLGELRGRAARMEAIADVGALRPVVEALMARQLVVALTGPGRGQIVTHALHTPAEMEKLQSRHAGGQAPQAVQQHAEISVRPAETSAPPVTTVEPPINDELAELREQVSELRADLDALRDQVRQLLGA